MAPKPVLEKKLNWHLRNTVGEKEYGFLFELDLYEMLLLIEYVITDSSYLLKTFSDSEE